MAGEIIYSYLNIPGASSSSRPPQRSQHLSSPPCPRWHRIAVGAGWAGNVVLTIAVIALGVWGQTRGTLNTSENNETRIVSSTECSSCLEDFRSRLKPILCEPHNGSLAEDSGCKLCPRDWLLHGDTCYWLSKKSKNWTGSRDDCLWKSAQMLVIQNREEMDSIQNLTQGANDVWIGLTVTLPGGKWTWVDGSPLDPMLFSGSAAGNSCASVKGTQIQSETCTAEFKWICQKEAAVI
ncbi:killer cell lectin-like receptor subfamily B member 1B allele C [Mauremys mutica]|uniref:killer cell lectin-like receptor subfamily B member 1B allele C n=1 Tax=Mauremys mutica TaxID=74926 RepID=UPI001D1605E6|nr:killer cell lectin-like receptor subfamily B member 1B allele C [Mauremys mutica]